MIKNILVLAVIGLLLFFILNPSDNSKPVVITHIDTLYKDTIIDRWHKGKDIHYEVLKTIHDTTNLPIGEKYDSTNLQLVQIRAYQDSFLLDSNKVFINDTIKGELLGRSFRALLQEKTIKVTQNTIKPEKNSIYIGGVANPQFIGAGIFLKKDKQLIGISINSNQSVNLSYYVKIY